MVGKVVVMFLCNGELLVVWRRRDEEKKIGARYEKRAERVIEKDW